ncbi:hypothetical protein D041_3971B, partial [Vibrio parahaemolyticus EKP-008]
EKLY